MKPHVLGQGNAIKLSYKITRYGKYSITVSVVESWNKIKKQFKKCYLKIYPPKDRSQ